MFRKLTLTAATMLALTSGQVFAAEAETEIEDFAFSFEGPFGSFDQMQLQRGLQIYTEVCSACHGLEFVAFRTLHDEGGPALPEDQMRAYAEFYEVYDESIEDYRAATPADKFPAVTGAGAPDLSLMAKSRAGFHGPLGSGINQLVKGMGGAEYIASILSGYHETPECAPEDFDGYYNVAFAPGGYPEECLDDHGHRTVPGSWIGMAPPLWGDDVEYADGHSTELHHEAQDVAAFLMWTAEPKMMARKQAGLSGVILLIMLSVLLYLTNKRLWAPHKHKD
ncbi:ubiquinol-cytochrome c reductase cytochrome c1 subunit [Yoonia maritima]|uniref:Cytochrome c1 n=2 Tax=Yoonia maritima TaxID=1435347 RepID=A0A2T0VVQ8_9RHOB|nr:ubiquinol-cytochrome c reductase cytochrome c1 subunit [Yoonia maritima]